MARDFSSINRLKLAGQLQAASLDPDALQRLFDENDIDINVQEQTGFENILRLGGSVRIGYNEARNDYLFVGADMTNMAADFSNKQYYVFTMVRALRNGSKNGLPRVIINDRSGKKRELTLDSMGDFHLSRPEDVLKKPEKPSWFHCHANRIFGSYQQEMAAYRYAMATYLEQKTFLDAPENRLRKKP